MTIKGGYARRFVGPTTFSNSLLLQLLSLTSSSTTTTTFVSSMSTTTTTTNSIPYPRAAVATTLQWTASSSSDENRYLLVQRANPPDQGLWSIPGGKLEVGEKTIDGAKRELHEETKIRPDWCEWYENPFLTTDAIFRDNDK